MYFTSLFDMMFRSLKRIHVNWRTTIFKSLCLTVCFVYVQAKQIPGSVSGDRCRGLLQAMDDIAYVGKRRVRQSNFAHSEWVFH